MTARLLVAASPGEWRAALVTEIGLTEFRLVREIGGSRVGEIHVGRILRLLPALPALLIDIGEERPAYLAADESKVTGGAGALTEGAAVLVQIKRDARADKAIGVTRDIRLSGRYVEWMPTRSGVIGDVADPTLVGALRNALGPGEGARLLPEAGDASAQAVIADVEALRGRWLEIEQQRQGAKPPCRLAAVAPVAALLHDLAAADPTAIVVDDAALFAAVRAWLLREAPALAARLRRYSGRVPLFEAEGIAGEVASLMEPRIALASGGAVSIEPTSAAVLIDVDSGGLAEEQHFGAAALMAVNLDAAAVIARQIRLRGLAGALVVDFIPTRRKEQRERLLAAFRTALRSETPDVQLLGWTRLGHVELTRPRRAAALHEILFEPSERGTLVKTPLTVALDALAAAQRAADAAPGRAVGISLHLEVAVLLDGLLAPVRRALEQRLGRPLAISGAPSHARTSFEIAVA